MEQAEFEALQVGDYVFTLSGTADKWEEVEIEKLYNDDFKRGATVRFGVNGDKWAEARYHRSFIRREQLEMKPKPKIPQPKKVWLCHETGEWAETGDKAIEKFVITKHYLNMSNRHGKAINGRHYYRTILKDGIPQKLELAEEKENDTASLSH